MNAPLAEFSLIERFFDKHPVNRAVSLGIGDDCALMTIPPDHEIAITTDTMVENVHFFADCAPADLGHKLLAVNLSDLAAMGAKPLAVTLALTLPKPVDAWLNQFAHGLFKLAKTYNVDLIGGDTTSGPLTLTIQAFGLIPKGKALKRSSAQPGDLVCVTGLLGEAGLGLKIKQGYPCDNPTPALERFHRPMPRIDAGLALLDAAHACIDISDGLVGDLGHILKRSDVGALLDWDALPLSAEVSAYIQATGNWHMPITAGDDYELCFTISPDKADCLVFPFSIIGSIESEPGLRIRKNGVIQPLEVKSFEHFS